MILTEFTQRTGRTVSRSEVRSWKESLVAVARVVNDDSIPGDCGVAIEYGIPQTSKRIDFMLSGTDADDVEQLVIIELKQWERAHKTDRDGIVRAESVLQRRGEMRCRGRVRGGEEDHRVLREPVGEGGFAARNAANGSAIDHAVLLEEREMRADGARREVQGAGQLFDGMRLHPQLREERAAGWAEGASDPLRNERHVANRGGIWLLSLQNGT